MVLWSLFDYLVDVRRGRGGEKDMDVGYIRCHETSFVQMAAGLSVGLSCLAGRNRKKR